ncbi:hypothetical protein EYF80_063535 [Liparis tanakae]|uniref:Uncharacterized protein n=1 Tax=Liparis tanakae TaxID=230148 RepID=A0A4Z2EBS0_9TELE|nr:hypothetical protein EYF80_063535 [Liparis tanakae]
MKYTYQKQKKDVSVESVEAEAIELMRALTDDFNNFINQSHRHETHSGNIPPAHRRVVALDALDPDGPAEEHQFLGSSRALTLDLQQRSTSQAPTQLSTLSGSHDEEWKHVYSRESPPTTRTRREDGAGLAL